MYQWMLELHTVCPSWVLLGEIAAPKKTERKQKCCSSSSTNVWDLRIKAVVKAVANTSLGTQRSAAVARWMGQCPRRVVRAVWHTVYTKHYWDHCRVVTIHHCSAAVSVTWSAVCRPDGGRGGGVLCSPLLSSHDRCPAPPRPPPPCCSPSGLTITTMLFSALIFLANTNQQSWMEIML